MNPGAGTSSGNNYMTPFLNSIQKQADEQTSHVQTQVSNYKTRLEASGINADDAIDTRNVMERLTNLPDNQNWLFDIMELINRPVKGLMGGLENITSPYEQDSSVLKSMADGLTGKNRDFTGAQVVRNIFSGGAEKDGFGWEDVAGFGLEMTLDPMRLALFAATGGTSEAAVTGAKALSTAQKVAGTTDTVADVTKGLKLVRDAGKGLNYAGDIASAGKGLTGIGPEALKALTTGAKGAQNTTKIVQGMEMVGKTIANEHKLSKVPQVLESIGRLVKGEEVTGGLRKIREAQGAFAKSKETLKAVGGVSGMITDPNFYLFSEVHNATHISALSKAFRATTGGASRLAKAGIDFGTNKYMGKVANLMETNPELAMQKANNYLELDESVRRLLSKAPKFTKQTENASTAKKEFIKVEAHKINYEFMGKAEAAYDKVKGLEYIDDVTGQAVKYFDDMGDLNRTIFDIREMQGKAIEKSLYEFVGEMSSKTGVGKTLSADARTINELTQLLGGSDLAEFGIKTIPAVGEGTASLVFDHNMWARDNMGQLVNKITKANPEAGLSTLTLGKEISPKSQMVLNELQSSQALAPVRELLDDFSKGIEQIQSYTGDLLFGDEATILASTKAHFGDGYVPHSLSDEGADLKSFLNDLNKKSGKKLAPDELSMAENLFYDAKRAMGDLDSTSGVKRAGIRGDSRILQSRKLEGTAYQNNQMVKNHLSQSYGDINKFMENFPDASPEMHSELMDLIKNTDWFSRDASRSILDLGFDRAESANKIAIKTQLALGETFGGHKSGYEGLQLFTKGQRVPTGLEKLGADEIQSLRASLETAQMYTQAPAIDTLLGRLELASAGKGTAYIDSSIKSYVMQSTRTDVDVFLDGLDNFTNSWKKLKVSSPAYQMRNVTGNLYNATASGQTVPEAMFGVEEARKKMKQLGDIDVEGSIINKYVKGGKLTPDEQGIFDMFRDMKVNGFLDDGNIYALEGIRKPSYTGPSGEKNKAQEALDWVSDKNMQMNQSVDDWFRMSTYEHAKNNPAYMKKLGVNNPIDAVKLVHFDATDLTVLEDKYIRKLVPFYNFNRQNLKFQLSRITSDPERLRMFTKKYALAWNMAGVDVEDLPEWQRDNFALPVPFMGNKGDGEYTSLKSNLPIGDLVDYTTEPLKAFMSSLNPVIRAPFEVVLGRQVFSGRDVDLDDRQGRLGYLTEFTGLDVPLRLPKGALQAIKGDPVQGLSTFMAATRRDNLDSVQKNKDYRELEKLKKYFDELKKQGIEIPTIPELRKAKVIQ